MKGKLTMWKPNASRLSYNLVVILLLLSRVKRDRSNNKSCNPKHTKTSLPYCLALRLCRICSTDTLFQKRTHEMKLHLLQRATKMLYTRCNQQGLISHKRRSPHKQKKPKNPKKSPIHNHLQSNATQHTKNLKQITHNSACF